jgi:alkanesulfonate monooxygenase SsuD/methylene tetrahydromethanopterin reductase-like flavin-dependent oxidoreductase (luciferase family)
MTNGRDLKIGTGRGTAKREYDGLGISQMETRTLFAEHIEVLRLAMANEWFSYEGEHFQIPRTTLRPAPRDRQFFNDRLYMAWVSQSSLAYMAQLDLLPIILPNQSWDQARVDIVTANQQRVERGLKPGRPVTVMFTYCAESDAKADEEVGPYMANQNFSGASHYQFGADHWKDLPGYEDNALRARALTLDPSAVNAIPLASKDVGFLCGSPVTIIEKLRAGNRYIAPDELVAIISFGGMPRDLAERSMRLLAREVLPVVQGFEPQPPPIALEHTTV